MGNCQTISEDGEKRISSKFGGKPQIMIKTYTWSRDSHGLFDYESKNLTKKNLKTNNPGRIIRQGNDIRLAKESEKNISKDEKELIKLSLKDGAVFVDNCREPKDKVNEKGEESLENVDYDLWLVVKSMKTNANNKGYKLSEGDLIKLGRVKFRIRELQGFATKAPKCEKQTKIEDDNISVGESEKKSCDTPKGSQTSVAQVCRICLGESPETGDPFFSPCNCTGTMKYIHIKCLQRWLKSKLHIKQSNSSTSVYWKTLECELCKTPFPTFFVVDSKRYDIVEVDRPECPYIILDILSKDKSITRGIHVIKMENKTNIRLGRGHDSDIRITDISVSRCHAFIKLEKGEFYIDDNNSKFGTLVHLKKAFSIPHDCVDVSLQVGRTVVALTVKRGRRFLSACFSSHVENNNTSHEERNSESEEEEEGDIDHDEPQNNPDSARNDRTILANNGQANSIQRGNTNVNIPPRDDHQPEAEAHDRAESESEGPHEAEVERHEEPAENEERKDNEEDPEHEENEENVADLGPVETENRTIPVLSHRNNIYGSPRSFRGPLEINWANQPEHPSQIEIGIQSAPNLPQNNQANQEVVGNLNDCDGPVD